MRLAYEIKDPVHGFIRITEEERRLIDSRPLQRLRRIKQLGKADLTYPGATHSRFLHSLGVLHVAGLMAERLAELGHLSEDDVLLARLVGLLHDVGHGPFSHVFEEVLAKKEMTHEDVGIWLVKSSELGDLVEEAGFSKQEVAEIAFGRQEGGKAEASLVAKAMWSIISPDTMDYLVRDSYFAGVAYGRIDIGRIVGTVDLVEGELAIEYPGGLTSFEDYVLSRLQMFNAVYFHKTVRAANVMLARAMEWADEVLDLTELKDVDFFLKLDDCYMRTVLVTLEPDGKEAKLARELAERLEARRLLKCVFESPASDKSDLLMSLLNRPCSRKRFEAEIAEEAGVEPEEVFIDAPSVPSVPMRPGGELAEACFFTTIPGGKRLVRGEEVRSLVLGLARHVDVVRVYALPEHREAVRKACERVFGVQAPGGRIAV